MKTIKFTILSLLIFASTAILAQNSKVVRESIKTDSTQEVVVEKEYVPIIREAERITLLPNFQDTTKVQLDFAYDIQSSVLYGTFSPREIQPAKLMGEPIYPIERAYVLLGLGNYLSGIGQLRVGSLRQEEYQWFFGADYHGSFGKITDQWKKSVDASFSDTEVLANGKRLFERSALEGKIQFNQNNRTYYGTAVNPDSVATTQSINDNNFQKVTKFIADISLYSFTRSKKKPNFTTSLLFNHLKAEQGVTEDKFAAKININRYYNAQFLGMEAKFQYINNEGLMDTLNNLIVDFNPWLGLYGKTWQIQAGVNTTYDEKNTKYHIYPNVKLHYNIAAFFLVPYIEIAGNYQINTFEQIVTENYFINPRLWVTPTENRIIVNGGLRGMVSSRLGFNVNINYQKTDNQYFYVIDTLADPFNRLFNVEYDNMSTLTIGGELTWKQSDELNIILRGQYSTFTLDSLAAPWHTPRVKADLTTRYRMYDKFTISGDLFFRGERPVKKLDGTEGTLDPLVDINIMAEYQLNRIIGFFIRGGNLLNRRQYVYDNYMLHRLNFKLGAKLLF